MHNNRPLVSIGMPVYNEERFIKESIESILSQDYTNIEIIISDNNSTDNTRLLIENTVKNHDNVRTNFFDKNMGVTENFKYVYRTSSGSYFIWASGHDLWATNYISECVEALENNQDAVIAFGTTTWIDEHGDVMCKQSGWSDTRGMHPVARLFTIYWGSMNPILGVIRKSALLPIQDMENFVGADLAMLAHLSLSGEFIHTTDTEWGRREFRHESNYEDKLNRYSSEQFGITKTRLSRLFPLMKLPLELIRAITKSELSFGNKLLSLFAMIAALPVRYAIGKTNKARTQ